MWKSRNPVFWNSTNSCMRMRLFNIRKIERMDGRYVAAWPFFPLPLLFTEPKLMLKMATQHDLSKFPNSSNSFRNSSQNIAKMSLQTRNWIVERRSGTAFNWIWIHRHILRLQRCTKAVVEPM